MNERALMQRALDALEACTAEEGTPMHEVVSASHVIVELRAALAAPVAPAERGVHGNRISGGAEVRSTGFTAIVAPAGEKPATTRTQLVNAWNELPFDLRINTYLGPLFKLLQSVADDKPATSEPVATMSTTPDHWSDCSVYNEPAYPAGPCDCMPTPAMCRAAVEFLNGPDVYDMLPGVVLEIEEGIYREVWRAMQKAAPAAPPDVQRDAARYRWLRDSGRIPASDDPEGHIIDAAMAAKVPT